MTDGAGSPLPTWENFYVIVGSAGAALVGLQFVVMTLIAGMRTRATSDSVSAFGTPTVFHFASALVVSAVMSAPWPSLFSTSVALGICGLWGLAYGAIVFRRALRQTDYEPVWEDWLWYTLLPCSAYAALALAALSLRSATRAATFVVAGVALGLLLIGIHNAWDAVTHMVVSRAAGDAKRE